MYELRDDPEPRPLLRVVRDEDPPTYDAGQQSKPRVNGFVMFPWDVYDRLKGDGAAQLVLLALMRRANKDGECWPSVALLCEETGKSDKHVRATINRLVSLGIVSKSPRSVDGMKSVNTYRINLKTAEVQIGTEYRTCGNGYRTDRYSVPDSAVPSTDRSRTNEPEPEEVIDKPRKRGTRIPDDFTMTPEMIRWAQDHGIPAVINLSWETEKFCNYWGAKSGAAACKTDWVKTWRNWMMNAKDRAPRKPTDPNAGGRGQWVG